MIGKYIKRAIGILFMATFVVACNSQKSQLIQEAREQGLRAAQALVATEHDNIIKMEGAILEAKACQSKYLLMGDTLAAREFDTAFREYLKIHDELLAKELFD